MVGSLFVTSYVLREPRPAAGRRTGPLARLLALAGGGLSLYTAWLGGKLVEEYGEAVKPVMEQQQVEEEGHEDDDRDRLSRAVPCRHQRGNIPEARGLARARRRAVHTHGGQFEYPAV